MTTLQRTKEDWWGQNNALWSSLNNSLVEEAVPLWWYKAILSILIEWICNIGSLYGKTLVWWYISSLPKDDLSRERIWCQVNSFRVSDLTSCCERRYTFLILRASSANLLVKELWTYDARRVLCSVGCTDDISFYNLNINKSHNYKTS